MKLLVGHTRLKLLLSALILSSLNAFAQNALSIDVSGDWRKSADDQPAYAQAIFDDSAWQVVRLPWRSTQERGVYWLRKSIVLPEGADEKRLALTFGCVSEIYTAFVNGVRIGGADSSSYAQAEIPHPHTFTVPAEATGKDRRLNIAIRYARGAMVPQAWQPRDNGPYLLTDLRHAPLNAGKLSIELLGLRNAPLAVFASIELLIGLLLVRTWMADRTRPELLLFAIYLLLRTAELGNQLGMISEFAHPFDSKGAPVPELLLSSMGGAILAEFILVALNFRPRWLAAMLWGGWIVFPLSLVFGGAYRNLFYDTGIWTSLLPVSAVAVDWIRLRRGRVPVERYLFNFVMLLPLLSGMDRSLTRSGGQFIYDGVIRVGSQDLITLFLAGAIVVLLLRSLATDRRERARLSGEFEAARASQQLLLAQSTSSFDGFEIDAVYRPAQEVGGDLYCVLRDGDASLVITGDVSGKGLKAAMLVSLVIGVLRTTKERRPAALLTDLNRAVFGQTEDGFITCSCARIGAHGEITLANAGQLAPYLDGVEQEASGDLPLGVLECATYDELGFELARGQQLTFLSDGVIEAANSKRELFGFERARSISTQAAEEIANQAQAFGQNDDITVVTVRRRA